MSMIDKTKAAAPSLLVAFSLALTGTAALAQDAQTPAAPAAEAPTTPAPAAEAPATPAAETPAAPADGPGTIYVKETSGAWQVRCMRVEAGKTEPCNIFQMLKDEKGNEVAAIEIAPRPAGEKAVAGATISVPLETLLQAKLVLQIDQSEPLVYDYAWCDRVSCLALAGFTEENLKAMKNGKEAIMTIVPALAPDQKVQTKISLDGITKGYDGLPVPPAQK